MKQKEKIMKNIIKKVTVAVIASLIVTGFAQAQERLFKASIAEAQVMEIMTQSTQNDGWNIVKKSKDKQLIVGKEYTKRVIMNRKPVRRVKGDIFVALSFTEDGYTLQVVNEEGKVHNSLSHKEQNIFAGLASEIEKQLAHSLI